MFTGIVEEMGVVQEAGEGCLAVKARTVLEDARVGDSIAVSGACLTVTSIQDNVFAVDLAPETLRRTSLGTLRPGDPVNLERALPAGGRLGGHIVQGHVDATGRVTAVREEADALLIDFAASPEVMRYIVEKGFVAVDGVSLTIVSRDPSSFSVTVIPLTQQVTTLGTKHVGSLVNLEVDILAKYVEALVPGER